MAVKLGYINVDAMLRKITAKQFIEWEAYARMEPFNELRADSRAASITQMIFNMAVDPKHREDSLEKFLLKYGDKPKRQTKPLTPKQTQAHQNRVLEIWAATMAGSKAES